MAKKYIDAELLRKEIESRMGDCDANSKNPNQLLWAELAALIPFIDSLQQEQSCDTCTNDKGCVTCKDGELWEGKEQPSEGLKAEEEIEKYMDIRGLIWYDDINLSDFAHHFYELGRQSKESISKDLEEEYKDKDWGILQDMSIEEED